MTHDAEKLKAVDITELARRLGLDFKGKNARCFNQQAHPSGDKNPSLGFDGKANRFKCFACGVSGSPIDLVMQTQDLDFKGACEWLEQTYGITPIKTGNKRLLPKPIAYNEPTATNEQPDSRDKEVYQRLYDLSDPLNKEGLDFLINKGFTGKTIACFGWKTLTDKAIDELKEGFNKDELEHSGLFNDGKFKFYYHRLLIPYRFNGKIIYLRGRTLAPDKPKIINPTGKATQLYNLDVLTSKPDHICIAEGETDTMSLTQAGEPAIGIMGATQTEALEKVARFVAKAKIRAITAFDNDRGGDTARELAVRVFNRQGVKVEKLNIPKGYKDFSDYLLSKKRGII